MVCLPCAKEILDGIARLTAVLTCMGNTMKVANPHGNTPTRAQTNKFLKVADELALLAGEIEQHVAGPATKED
jgi:hypothetical protein